MWAVPNAKKKTQGTRRSKKRKKKKINNVRGVQYCQKAKTQLNNVGGGFFFGTKVSEFVSCLLQTTLSAFMTK